MDYLPIREHLLEKVVTAERARDFLHVAKKIDIKLFFDLSIDGNTELIEEIFKKVLGEKEVHVEDVGLVEYSQIGRFCAASYSPKEILDTGFLKIEGYTSEAISVGPILTQQSIWNVQLFDILSVDGKYNIRICNPLDLLYLHQLRDLRPEKPNITTAYGLMSQVRFLKNLDLPDGEEKAKYSRRIHSYYFLRETLDKLTENLLR